MKRILFPTDFSPTARNAFEYVLQLADELGATVDVMTVYHLPGGEASQVPPHYIERMLEEKRQEALEKLKSFIQDHPQELIGKLRTDYGTFVYQEIIDAAEKDAYDLIVMGSKGERNAIEKILGSVTSLTMLHAPCPVLAVPEGATFRSIEHIVYATDFRPTDEHAVADLMEMAGTLGAKVHFVHIDTSGKEGTEIEEEILSGESPFAFTDFTIVSSPTVAGGLEEYLQREQTPLLALFIPRRRFWERLFHNSVTKKMTYHGQTPVLVFHQ